MEIVKEIYRKILRILPDKVANHLIYFKGYRKILNLKDPKYFGEKIQWLKMYGNLQALTKYADKYEVRNFVRKTIGEEYLNKLYGVYEHPNEIDYKLLPGRFVLKSTNGSGAVLICKNKSDFDQKRAKKTMEKWLADDFYRMKKEPQYKGIKNRIIAEEYLEDETGGLRDYKFYCFDGEPHYYGIFTDRYANKTIDMYTISGKKLEGVHSGGAKISENVLLQGEDFPHMVEIARKLSEPFHFVRVDLYYVQGRIYFGELTFTDGAGSEAFTPLSFDLEIAEKIQLSDVLRKKRPPAEEPKNLAFGKDMVNAEESVSQRSIS